MVESRQALSQEIGNAWQLYQRTVHALDDEVGRQLGLGPADLRCLDWLFDGPKTAGQLSTAIGLKPAATTALIDRLAAKGLLERIASDSDRRQVLVRMTDDGYARTGAFYGPMVVEAQQMLTSLTRDELEVVAAHLHAVTELTDRHRKRLVEARGKTPHSSDADAVAEPQDDD